LSTQKHTFDPDASGIGCDTCPMPANHHIHDVTRPAINAPTPVITHNQSAASQAAGEASRLRVGSLRAKAYSLIATAPNGATSDEIEVELQRSHQSVSSAVNYLASTGHITPLVRDGAEVRRTTRSGSEAVAYTTAGLQAGAA
jgi:hypothetical protein